MRLKLVRKEEAPVDIYAAIRAKREAIDWEAVHINGDKGVVFCPPLNWRVGCR